MYSRYNRIIFDRSTGIARDDMDDPPPSEGGPFGHSGTHDQPLPWSPVVERVDGFLARRLPESSRAICPHGPPIPVASSSSRPSAGAFSSVSPGRHAAARSGHGLLLPHPNRLRWERIRSSAPACSKTRSSASMRTCVAPRIETSQATVARPIRVTDSVANLRTRRRSKPVRSICYAPIRTT